MPNYGIKILKPNAPSRYDVKNAPPRYLTILSSVESHKIFIKTGVYCSSGYTYYHNLGYVPAAMAWVERADGSLAPASFGVNENSIYISCYNRNIYFVIFYEG